VTVLSISRRARYVAANIQPPGEKPVRAHGLVEIRESGWPRYYLFQLPGGRWFIQAEAQNAHPSENPVDPLDVDLFESALVSILR
jgi:hypothetical protein